MEVGGFEVEGNQVDFAFAKNCRKKLNTKPVPLVCFRRERLAIIFTLLLITLDNVENSVCVDIL